MSQVKFHSALPDDTKVEIVGGWDEPQQGYHFSIFALEDDLEEGEDDVIYCNLRHSACPFPRDNDIYRTVLKLARIIPPPGFWERVERKEGDVIYEWDGDAWHKRTHKCHFVECCMCGENVCTNESCMTCSCDMEEVYSHLWVCSSACYKRLVKILDTVGNSR